MKAGMVVGYHGGYLFQDVGETMNTEEQRADRGNVEHIKSKISNLFSQCLNDIENAVSEAGLNMKDVGVDVGTYVLCGDTRIVEVKLKL